MVGPFALRASSGLLLIVLLAAGCQTTSTLRPSSAAPSAASWRDRPTSWEKLDDIEAWLDAASPSADRELYAEARLQLAEGLLEFAQRDRGAATEDVIRFRLRRAGDLFAQVEGDPNASWSQQSRARTGAARIEALKASPVHAGPAILSRTRWGAARPILARLTRHNGPWTKITVHHTTEPTSTIGGADVASASRVLRKTQSYHMTAPERLYGDIGYHYLIDPSGRIYEGRSLAWQGAHAYKQNNVANIGICLLGHFDRERPSPRALESLEELIESLRERYSIPRYRVYGHQEMRATACPGARLMSWVKGYRAG